MGRPGEASLRDVGPGWMGCGGLLVVVVGQSCVEWWGKVRAVRGGRHAKGAGYWE